MRCAWFLAGFAVGFAAASLLAVGGGPREVERVDSVTCLECGKSRWESHGGDAQLVCWARPAEGGRVVRPSGWCVEAEGRDA